MGILSLIVIIFLIFALFPKIDLFFVSFMPLFIILIIKVVIENPEFWHSIFQLNSKNLFWLIILLLMFVPLIVFLFRSVYIIFIRKNHRKTGCILNISHLDDSIVSYIMTYFIPLMSLSYNSPLSDYVTNILLFALVMIIYIRMDLLYLNPVFILFGLNVYIIKVSNQDKFLLTNVTFAQLSSKTKNKEKEIELIEISNNFFFKWFKKE